jgi:hypothetical protein
MSTPTESSLAEQRVREITADLEDDGWRVLREPGSPELPPGLRPLRVDFIALRGPDILVGEVTSRKTAPSRRLEAVAKIVETIPHAQFEVYWLGDEETEEPSHRQIRRYLKESRAIAQLSPQASLLMAIAAFEAALPSYAESAEVVAPGPPRRLLEHLFSLGLVSPSDRSLLVQLYKLRSSIVHTATPVLPRPADIAAVRSLAERMASGKYVSVDVMTDWLRDYLLDTGAPLQPTLFESLPKHITSQLSEILKREFPSASAKERQQAVLDLGDVTSITG